MTEFLKNSYVPDNTVSSVLIAGNAPSKLIDYFQKNNIHYILTNQNKFLPLPTSYHPDMQLFPCGNGVFIIPPSNYNTYQTQIKNAMLIKGNTNPSSTYPSDIAYNVAKLESYAFCNEKYTDQKILAYLHQENVKIINVKQGYSKCSVCIVTNRAIITADRGLYDAFRHAGFEALLIRPGHISLPGYNFGFIGGCSGLVEKGKLLFCGDVTKHPDFSCIAAFCKQFDTSIEWIDTLPLTDIGSIIPLTQLRG